MVSTKFAARSEGRIVDMGRTRVYERGRLLAGRFRMPPEIAEIIVRESDAILGE